MEEEELVKKLKNIDLGDVNPTNKANLSRMLADAAELDSFRSGKTSFNLSGLFNTRMRTWQTVLASTLVIAIVAGLAVGLPMLAGKDNEMRPASFIAKVYAATENLSSYRLTKTVRTEADGQFAQFNEVEISCLSPSEYDIIFTSDIDAKPSEIFLDGENVYLFEPDKTGIETPNYFGSIQDLGSMADLGYGTGVALDKEGTLELISWLTGLEKLPDATIDGVKCFHYTGNVDMKKYAEKYKETKLKQSPEMADDPRFLSNLDYVVDLMQTASQEAELWVGKEDYLLRNVKLTMTISGFPGLATEGEYAYEYPTDFGLTSPLNSNGSLLPGWYLLSDGIFTLDSSTKTQYLADSLHFEMEGTLTNVSGQECSDIRLLITSGGLASGWQDIHPAAIDSSEASFAPGEGKAFHASWDVASSNPSEYYLLTGRVFVEFVTTDGIQRIQILETTMQ